MLTNYLYSIFNVLLVLKNYIDHFLETIFSQEGHKWLKSVHRYNDKQKPAIMAWETVSSPVIFIYYCSTSNNNN